jgi:alcohol dehydrogenase class IV
MAQQGFRAAGYPWRLHCGPGVIDQNLGEAVSRAGASRAFVICSPSINRRTEVVARIQSALGDRFAGVFDGIEKDSTFASVQSATKAAATAGADLLIAVGGGSVIVAVRAVAIFLGEGGSPFDLMTQYPEGKPAYSPRLMAPKLPIINIPTTPTSAMNRAGTGLKNPDLDHRMEYFDPKTRPQAIFLDDGALLSAPDDLLRSTATTVFASAVGGMSQTGLNPLAEGDRNHAFLLAHRSYLRLPDASDDVALRTDLAFVAFVQNRAEDNGRNRFLATAFSGNYAISTALHLEFPHVGQGESTSVVHASAIRLAENIDATGSEQVGQAIGVWRDGMTPEQSANVAADKLEEIYGQIGAPTRLRQLDIPQDSLQKIANLTVKNFNANAGARSADDQIRSALTLLETAW